MPRVEPVADVAVILHVPERDDADVGNQAVQSVGNLGDVLAAIAVVVLRNDDLLELADRPRVPRFPSLLARQRAVRHTRGKQAERAGRSASFSPSQIQSF